MIQIGANGLDHGPQVMRPVGNAVGAVGPSLLGHVRSRDALYLRGDDDELRGQLRVDDLEPVGNGANHACRAAAVAAGIHDDFPRAIDKPLGVAKATFDLKTKRGVHCKNPATIATYQEEEIVANLAAFQASRKAIEQ